MELGEKTVQELVEMKTQAELLQIELGEYDPSLFVKLEELIIFSEDELAARGITVYIKRKRLRELDEQ
jgi:hypothetical protein